MQSVEIDYQKEELEYELSKTRKVRFGSGRRPELVLVDEDETVALTQHQGSVGEVLKLGTQNSYFLTVATDRTMCIWSINGRLTAELSAHSERISAVWVFADKRIVSLGDDGRLVFWDARNGRKLRVVDTTIKSGEKVLLSAESKLMCLMEHNGARIISTDGAAIVTLRNQAKPFSLFHSLESGKWLTNSPDDTRLWSASGQLQHDFQQSFSFENGYCETDSGGLLIADNHHRVLHIDEHGRLSSLHDSDATIADNAREYFKCRNNAFASMRERPGYEHQPHHKNPISPKKHIAHKEWEKLELEGDQADAARDLWRFFNRPIFRSIKTALKELVDTARDCEASIRDSIEKSKDQRAALNRQMIRRFIVVLAGVAGVVAFVATGQMNKLSIIYRNPELSFTHASEQSTVVLGWFFGSILVALIGLLAMHGTRRRKRRHRNGVETLYVIDDQINDVIQQIKNYRQRMLNDLPIVKDRNFYNGSSVEAAFANVIDNKLEKMAMDQCGITRDEIIFKNQESIKLRDWAQIQESAESKQQKSLIRNKLSEHNLESFWWSSSGTMVFAVQYLQFVFLTRDKLDVFTVYYDFITDQAVGKEAHAFFYKDVTNISKRDVERRGSDSQFEATEIVLAVSSGEEIKLVVLNEDSVSALQQMVEKQTTENENEDILRELQNDLKRLDDTSMSNAQREEERLAILGDIADVESKQFNVKSVQFENKADEAIENIRNQIRIHKQQSGDGGNG